MIGVEEFVERLCRICAASGPRPFPRARRDREILVESILLGLDSGRTYEEREINARLKAWLRDVAPSLETDHVTLRRLLVDVHRLERTASGSSYRVAFSSKMTAFELAVYDLDLTATIAAYREYDEKRRREKRAAAITSRSD
ncbi:MAG TPA: DUF2087 domain-containing protein [Myxococcota bacterium]|nr:DUF2087 domain-containing protein [Myxococcota bacterium]